MFQVESEGGPAAAHRVRDPRASWCRVAETRDVLVRWSRGIWCDMAKVSGTRTGCKDMQGIHGNRSVEL